MAAAFAVDDVVAPLLADELDELPHADSANVNDAAPTSIVLNGRKIESPFANPRRCLVHHTPEDQR
jgi:hypothetical protein